MRGRRPKPTRLKLLQGNPGKRPLNRGEPKPRASVPTCPTQLSPAAKREWNRVAKELAALGLLTRIDRAALAAYCEAWATWLDAIEKVQRHGPVVKAPDSGFPMQSPYLSVANQAQKQMRAYLVEFGMTPSSRTRISTVPEARPKPGGLREFLEQRQKAEKRRGV